MRRYDELSRDQEPLLPLQFCLDCIIATRGYDFREGQPIPRTIQTVGHMLAMPVLGRTAPPIFQSVSFRQGQL